MSVDFPGIGDEINRSSPDLETGPEHWVFGCFQSRPPSLSQARGRQRTRHRGPLIEPLSNYQSMCLNDNESSAATDRHEPVWRPGGLPPTLPLTSRQPHGNLTAHSFNPFTVCHDIVMKKRCLPNAMTTDQHRAPNIRLISSYQGYSRP